MKPRVKFGALVASAAGLVLGCSQLLSLGDYAEVKTNVSEGGSSDGGGCDVDLSKACYPCAATTDQQLLNACTTGCVPFDQKRVTNLLADGGLPAVPPVSVDASTDASSTQPDAGGLPSCLTLNANPVVVVAGTAKPYVQALAAAVFNDSSPITVIYKGRSSCDAWNSVLQGVPVTGQASYWPGSPTETFCALPGSVQPDVIVADVFPSTCLQLPNGLPKDVGDFQGPVQTMEFVVPKASSQTSITAQAAYFVYGFGAASGVSPWTDAANIFRLDDASGTQAIVGAGIGVPGALWKGTNVSFSSQMVSSISAVPANSADKTIGILSAVNLTDQVRVAMHSLAYQHYGQNCSYYADSSETSKDKRNVRDGHYALWGPVHISTKLDGSGFPLKPAAKRVIDTLTGSVAPPKGLDLIETEALNNLVPTCAMHVSRGSEVGPLKPASSSTPCGCYFEVKATGATACKACSTSADCPSTAPACSFGYCEAQ